MSQKTLFDEPAGVNQYGYPISRRTDPVTSHEAADAEMPRLKTHQAMFCTALEGLGEATANEVASKARDIFRGVSHETVRKRARELERLGRIEAVGKRQCRCTRRNATVWRLVQDKAGRRG